MSRYRVLDLFSGIGGFSLGLERTGGFETVAFCEIEPFCQRVLAKHWPGVPCYDDVRALTAERLRADGIAVDVICGGFPCQDISIAGNGAGINGERSGLWAEYARLIGELRPSFVIVENVAALLGRGLDRVLRDLAEIGFDAEWHCIPASAVGAPHRRDRIWIVAYTDRNGAVVQGRYSDRSHEEQNGVPEIQEWEDELVGAVGASPDDVVDAQGIGWRQGDTNGGGRGSRTRAPLQWGGFADNGWWRAEPDVDRVAHGVPAELDGGLNAEEQHQNARTAGGSWPHECDEALGIWDREPDEPRVAHGVRGRGDRLKALGNAVVPQIPELIGRAILASEAA